VIPSYALLSMLLSGMYQVVLETTNLKAFILIAPRTDLFSQNRKASFRSSATCPFFLGGKQQGCTFFPGFEFDNTYPEHHRIPAARDPSWSPSFLVYHLDNSLPVHDKLPLWSWAPDLSTASESALLPLGGSVQLLPIDRILQS
jgi:hypothetical protein